MQVLFGHGWSFLLTSVAWMDDEGVMIRILASDGTMFERRSQSRDLTAEWRYESIYQAYTPVIVPSVEVALALLGCGNEVLDQFPRGPLLAPRHWVFGDRDE